MTQQSPPLIISVIGGGDPPPEARRLAYEVGRELARRGAMVACGGLGGVMEEVCRGAREEGGTTIGILPGDDASAANPYVTVPIATGMGYARNSIVAKAGGAVIAIDGAYGTLSEIGHALAEGITVVGLDTWTFSYGGREDTLIVEAADPADAAEKAVAAARLGTARTPRSVG